MLAVIGLKFRGGSNLKSAGYLSRSFGDHCQFSDPLRTMMAISQCHTIGVKITSMVELMLISIFLNPTLYLAVTCELFCWSVGLLFGVSWRWNMWP